MVQHVPGFPRFTLEANKMGGQACIRQYRFGLQQLLEMIDSGMTHAEIIAKFPFIERQDIDDAIKYAVNQASHTYVMAQSA